MIVLLAMVQVDVFWSYALGAGLALAASYQLARMTEKSLGDNPFLLKTVLFLACLFAPSGAWLLWEFTSWETMHAGTRELPAWLVAGFTVTNTTQGVLGFWVVDRLVARGRSYLAYLQVVAGYFAMFFVLVHGWDGTGYRRFFSPTAEDFRNWSSDNVGQWLGSPVALALYGMGAVMIPVLLVMMARWARNGQRQALAAGELDRVRPATHFVVAFLASVFVVALGSAIAASVSVHLLGWWAGIPLFAVLAYLGVFRPGGPVHRLHEVLCAPLASSGRGSTDRHQRDHRDSPASRARESWAAAAQALEPSASAGTRAP